MRPSELPRQPDGSIYHLGMQPGQASHRCLLVGDPGRVALAEPLLDSVQHRGHHREFVWVTGLYKGVSLTILGTGIGGDNTEIAVVELDALHNIDLSRGVPFPTQQKLYFLRVGTCGLLQADVPIGAVVFSTYGVGVDPLPFFYQAPTIAPLSQALQEHWYRLAQQKLPWYGVSTSSFFKEQAAQNAAVGLPWVQGITYSAAGFYGPQGRAVRVPIRYPHLPDWLAQFQYEGVFIQNIEMEVAPLYFLAQALGHEAGAICLGVAHRKKGALLYQNGGTSVEERMREVLRLGLEWLAQAP
ncbi:MAG: hypothetical protein N3A68_03230 [Bacteroidia bacterium]|nr:hypothetical protein [Bacteroidia bacterium]GIV24045.1 MAG: phosphorylase [Bacteroidia bacterium]